MIEVYPCVFHQSTGSPGIDPGKTRYGQARFTLTTEIAIQNHPLPMGKLLDGWVEYPGGRNNILPIGELPSPFTLSLFDGYQYISKPWEVKCKEGRIEIVSLGDEIVDFPGD
jgi:hypothetical protein